VVLLATMDSSDAVAIGVSVLATVVVLALLLGALSLLRTARRLRTLAEELDGRTDNVLGEVQDTVLLARGELARVDDLIGSAEALTETVGSASRLARTTLAVPVIKVLALGAGTARAGRRLRGNR
jgi:hypothetical protein